jgi:lincosamide nucleotidyltransferase A/C/D/E
MMSGPQVLGILDALAGAGIAAWVDGGWGVDALLGEQTREHEDLDMVIALADGERAEEALSALGFSLSEDQRPTRFVLAHADGRRIDFHTVVFDAGGGGVQQLQDGGSYRYPPAGFAGEGVIGGRVVQCLTPEVQLECHLGYEPDETDRHDMRLLAERFGLLLPRAYRA